MPSRLTHAGIAFAITVMVYQVYVLLAVPFVEPSLASGEAIAPENDSDGAKVRLTPPKYRELLKPLFPTEHWVLKESPKIFENGKAMILLDNYRPDDDGKVRVTKCAILFFPDALVRGKPAPRGTIVLEAPHGAVLQMDEGFRLGLGGMGQLQWGELVGQITLRSDMREPGPQDDLLLTTRDLYINEDLIRTDHRVDMRLGPHWGRGRELEIRLVSVERGRSTDAGPSLGGIDSLEVLHDVEAQITPSNSQMFGNIQTDSATPAPPVKVTSAGRFRFNFPQNKGSFKENVLLEQIHADGKRDHLSCELLTLYFTDGKDAITTSKNLTGFDSLGENPTFTKLQAGSLEALGTDSSPVLLQVESQQAMARCERLWIEIAPRRITLDGRDEVMLSYQGSEIHAPMVRYQAPPEGAAERMGTLLAAGNGRIRAVTGDKPTQQPLEIRWTDSMRLQRVEGTPVLSLYGRPRVSMIGIGRLWADQLQVFLRERADDTAAVDLLPGEVVPQRIVARGHVAIDSAALRGKVNQLEVRVEYDSSQLPSNAAENVNRWSGASKLASRSGLRQRAYHIDGNRLTTLLTVSEQETQITSLDVIGDVVFHETSTVSEGDQPLEVRADHIHMDHADSPVAEIAIKGWPAQVTVAGMSIHAESLRLNRGTSHALIESPGELHLPVDRDLSGKPLATSQPLAIRWQKGMELKENRITFSGDVVALTDEGSLQTEQMVALLATPVHFDGAARQNRTELAQLECHGGVEALFSQRDAGGFTSIQKIHLDEWFIANHQTGQLRGEGPGWLESVHLSSNTSPLSPLAARNGSGRLTSSAPPERGQRLQFLRVQFTRGVKGNIHERRVAVVGDCEAVYGPVDSWEQKLPTVKRGLPIRNTIRISSQELGVAQSPVARLSQSERSGFGPVELSAKGEVVIEGRSGERGSFTTHSHTATYDQQKTRFVLEGNSREPATITHEEYQGAPRSEQSFHKFTYNQTTDEVKVEGAGSGQWHHIELGNQPGTPGRRAIR